MGEKCGLCLVPQETYRIICSIDAIAYAVIPTTPIVEGHAMVLSAAHKKMEDLCSEELLAINKLLVYIKEKQEKLYPAQPPLIATHSDTKHGSIPEHFHYNLIPTTGNLEAIMSGYNHLVYKKELWDPKELERRAHLLR